jgi:hypothetical protein
MSDLFSIPSVKVEDGAGSFVVINKSDFDDKKHKLYAEPAKAKPETKTEPKK